jgi:DNA polymerase delta subunit 1
MILNWTAQDEELPDALYEDEDELSMEQYVIYLNGVTQNNESITIQVKHFTPYFYVKIPQYWRSGKINSIIEECKQSLSKKHRALLLTASLVKRKDAYGFTNQSEFKFIRFVFQTHAAYRRLKWNIKQNFKHLSLYNSNIDPMLVFMHTRNIEASGWIKITKQDEFQNKFSKAVRNVSCDWKSIEPIQCDLIPLFKICSFDIECYTDSDGFPSAYEKKDKIIQIGSTFQRFNETTHKKIVVVLGETDPIQDTELIVCRSEAEVLRKWFKLIEQEDPDMLIGYNIDGFDWKYIHVRAELYHVPYESRLSRIFHIKSKFVESKMESKQMGMNSFQSIRIPGRNQLDLYHYFKREYKLDSYSLDFVAKKYLNENKRPVTPRQIFSMAGPHGSSSSRAVVADYCAQDTMLPLRLLIQRQIVQTLIEMSKCVSVPISWLIERGQQIKVYSQVQRELRTLKYVVPEDIHVEDDGKYQGATVLNCERGLHADHPTAGLDFKSLYPSIIIGHNLCMTTLVLDKQYLNIPNVQYEQFKWEHGDYTFAKVPGIIPNILDRLGKERDRVKKQMKHAINLTLFAVLNARQLAIKVSMNSIYGVLGSNVGYIPMKPIASTVTYLGRKGIEHSKQLAESMYDGSAKCNGVRAKVIYGDSVTGDMPITYRLKDGSIACTRIDQIHHGSYMKRGSKEIALPRPNIQVWSSSGWSNVIRVIRHKVADRKKIYRVITQRGVVQVTDEHSLLDIHGNCIHVSELRLNETELLHQGFE